MATKKQSKLNEYLYSIPNGKSGSWKIEEFNVSEESAHVFNLGEAMNGTGRYVKPGKYRRLVKGVNQDRVTVMSNTPAEMMEMWQPIIEAHGDVLIFGLGLGVLAYQLCNKVDVTSVTVVEISKDVIALVLPTLRNFTNSKMSIVQSDMFEFTQSNEMGEYDYVCADIWDNISEGNTKDFQRLDRIFHGKDLWCWSREFLEEYENGFTICHDNEEYEKLDKEFCVSFLGK